MKVKDYFQEIFGEFEMEPVDLAEIVFRAGWNSAVNEAIKKMDQLPFGKDTQDSFKIWIKEIKE
jgi:hypothetical protein